MPKSLSLDIISPLVIADKWGSSLPWIITSPQDELKHSEREGGIFDLSSWGVVRVSGKDSKDFLQRMSSANLKTMPPAGTVWVSFLNAKAQTIALGMILDLSGAYLIVLPPGQSETLAAHLEMFHFQEELTIADVSSEWALLGIWIHGSSAKVKKPLAEGVWQSQLVQHVGTILWSDLCRKSLTYGLVPRAEFLPAFRALVDDGLKPLGYQLFEFYRLTAGVPQLQNELSGSEIILESNFDLCIARNKGCYPGQEVVERIFTYGNVNKKLFRVLVSWDHGEMPAADLKVPLVFEVDGKPVASVVSLVAHPSHAQQAVGSAYVQKSFWESNETLRFDNRVTLEFKKA